MSFLQALDATAIAARSSAALADPAAWTMAAPVVARPKSSATRDRYSWWTLARNPHALAVTGMVGAVLARDTLLRTINLRTINLRTVDPRTGNLRAATTPRPATAL